LCVFFSNLAAPPPPPPPKNNIRSCADLAPFQSVLYSTAYTSGISDIAIEFNTSETIVTLGLTFYLIGLAAGSVVVAPLSETFGRKPVSVISLAIFVIMIIPCGVAKSVTTLIVTRFIGALAGSVMISSAPGMVADLVPDEQRALAFSVWSLGPINGPGTSAVRYSPSLMYTD
jgi:MFS family permease